MDEQEFVKDDEFILVDLGNAKEETRSGVFMGLADGIQAFYF
jgi:hypothetical protein